MVIFVNDGNDDDNNVWKKLLNHFYTIQDDRIIVGPLT